MAYDETIRAGTQNKRIEIVMRDPATGQGKTGLAPASVTARYVREGQNPVAVTLDGSNWVEVDATNCPGMYRFTIPDAALSSGVAAVTLSFKAAGAIDKYVRIALISMDVRDPVRAGLTALPNANAGANGGLPTADSLNAVNVTTSSAASIASAVWTAGSRTLTAFADSPGVGTLLSRLTTERATYIDKLNLGSENIATASQVNAVATDVGLIQTDVTAVKVGVSSLTTMTETAGNPPYLRYKATALEQAPSGGGGGGGFTEQDRATLGAIKTKTDLISTAGVVLVHGPIDIRGVIRIIAGDAYTGSRALKWTVAGEDFTGKTLTLTIKGGTVETTFPCTGSGPHITCSLTSAQTQTIAPRVYSYTVRLHQGSDTITLFHRRRGFEVRSAP